MKRVKKVTCVSWYGIWYIGDDGCGKIDTVLQNLRPVHLAYQPPASSTFLSEQNNHQQPANSTFLSEQTSTSHQPPVKRTNCWMMS
jgi:hypothetical protein